MVWAGLVFCSVFAGWGNLVTPFQLRGGSDVVVPVTIAGEGPFRVQIDTGSSRSVVTRALAARLSARPLGHTTVVTPTGRVVRDLVQIERLVIGGRHFALAAMVVDGRLGAGVDGLIGQDVLAALTYSIDYRAGLIRWWVGAPAIADGVRLPLVFGEDGAVVAVPQTSSARPLQLIPDSGADAWVLFARAGRPLPPHAPLGLVAVTTVSGARLARGVVFDALDVGGLRLRDQRAVLVREDDARLSDGLMPLHLFARVTFDPGSSTLILER